MDALGLGNTSLSLERAQVQAADGRLRALAARAEGSEETRAGLEKAAKEFEGVFLNQLMKAMRNTVPENELFNSQGATKFYQQMHDAEIAKALAGGSGGVGVADLIVQQFERFLEEDPQETAGMPVAKPGTPERFGPPAPSVLARYREMSEVGNRTAAMARLRLMARHDGDASADTFSRYEAEMGAAARQSGLSPGLVLAVVMEESGGRFDAESPRGARGLMQLMPGTAAEVGVTDSDDPAQNLQGGATYLARMLDRYDGRLDLALAAYNAGPGQVDRAGRRIPDFPETRTYVQRVLARFERLGGGTELANTGP